MIGEVAVVITSAYDGEERKGDAATQLLPPSEVHGSFARDAQRLEVFQLELKNEVEQSQRSALHGSMDHDWVNLSHGFGEN